MLQLTRPQRPTRKVQLRLMLLPRLQEIKLVLLLMLPKLKVEKPLNTQSKPPVKLPTKQKLLLVTKLRNEE